MVVSCRQQSHSPRAQRFHQPVAALGLVFEEKPGPEAVGSPTVDEEAGMALAEEFGLALVAESAGRAVAPGVVAAAAGLAVAAAVVVAVAAVAVGLAALCDAASEPAYADAAGPGAAEPFCAASVKIGRAFQWPAYNQGYALASS